MSASTSLDRSRHRATPRHKQSDTPRRKRDWIGFDFANFATSQPSNALLPLLVLSLIVALGVAALRIDLIRTRYALATAMADERRLIEEQHALIVQKLQGRDPIELAVLARERGFRPAKVTRSVTDPMPLAGATISGLENVARPSVSAGPPRSRTNESFEDATP